MDWLYSLLKNQKMMMIRMAKLNDARSIHELSKELGYKPSLEKIKNNIFRFIECDYQEIFVAESDHIIGWMHVSLVEPLESLPFVELRGIVVNKNFRKQGIGTKLINASKEWAREKGCTKVRIRTNLKRTETREYYNNLGFESIKTQEVFELKI